MTTNTHRSRQQHLVDQFGHRVRQALNSGTDEVPERARQRLSAARATALARHKNEAQAEPVVVRSPALASPVPHGLWREPRFARLGFALAALVLSVGVLGISEWREQTQIDELAELDSDILTDELPFTAHLDPNYKTLLASAP